MTTASNVVALFDPRSPRDRVASAVRAEMARRKVTGNMLPRLVGNSQSYWARRIDAKVAFDVDDLHTLADLLQVHPAVFLGIAVSGNVPPDGPLAQSAELRTFNPKSPTAPELRLIRAA